MDEPPTFYGGIIADPMGLGKTLTVIALIASDANNPSFNDPGGPSGVLGEESCGLTLVVVPPACKCLVLSEEGAYGCMLRPGGKTS